MYTTKTDFTVELQMQLGNVRRTLQIVLASSRQWMVQLEEIKFLISWWLICQLLQPLLQTLELQTITQFLYGLILHLIETVLTGGRSGAMKRQIFGRWEVISHQLTGPMFFTQKKPEEACRTVTEIISDAMSMYIPNMTVMKKPGDKPWFKDKLQKCS